MRQDHPVTFATLLIVFAMVGESIRRNPRPEIPPMEALTGFQDADAPLLLPADGQPRHGLDLFSAWQLAEIPTALRFEAPLGSQHGALTASDGNNLNGIGGKNTDLGDPVFATADGLVVFAGQASPESGNTLILAHRDRNGRLLQSMYSHLDRIDVTADALVSRGQKIGTVGTANGYHPAQLHFEMRQEDIGLGGGSQLDPEQTVRELAGATEEDLVPSPLGAGG